jgi:hypothetical protein
MSVPSAKDKEKLVIDLVKKGYKTREIVKLAHVSNTTVTKIRAKLSAEAKEEQEQQDDQRKKPLSVSSQAFNLFQEGKSVVEVAIKLDLPTDQISKIHSDYLTLRNMGKASVILMEHRNDLGAYLGLFDFVNENKIRMKDLNHAVGLAQNINNLKSEKAQLEYDMDMLMDEKKWYEKELDEIKREYYKNH